jgi:hypothetical protein
MADVGRRRLDARDEAARQRREQYMERRRQEATDERSAMEQEMGEAGSRMPTPRPVRAAPTPARRAAPARRREMTADELNALSLGEGGRGPEAELARMRMEQRRRELEEKGTAFKKGGYVKPKAAPKKMMRGGAVAKPKPAAATKPKAKPMPFKKGGVIKKGRK